MKKVFAILVMLSFVIGMFTVLAVNFSGETKEEPQTARTLAFFSGVEKTWDAGSAGDASGVANWDPVGVPETGDNVTYDATSVYNCNWDIEVTLGDFSMLTGYTGTVTQGVDFGCVDFTLDAGIFVMTTGIVIAEGNWSSETGTFTAGTGTVVLNETGDLNARNLGSSGFYDLSIGYTDKTTTLTGYPNIKHSLIVNGGILEPGAFIIVFGSGNAFSITGTGTINPSSFVPGDGASVFATVNWQGTVTFASDISIPGIRFLPGTTELIINQIGDLTITEAFYLADYANKICEFVLGEYDFNVENLIMGLVGRPILTAGDNNITCSGDWDTIDGEYSHEENVVYLTGDDKDIDMASGDSFYNVTIETGANYTINSSGIANVDLRATIIGTLYAGDFIEPEPEFTNEMWPHACPGVLYEHIPTQKYWDTFTLVESPYWLHDVDGVLKGLPNENDTGIYYIVMTLTWNDMTTYQNTTLIVCPDTFSAAELINFNVLFQLILFGVCVIGLLKKIIILPIMTSIGSFVVAIATIEAFGDLYMFAIILVLINVCFSAITIIRIRR